MIYEIADESQTTSSISSDFEQPQLVHKKAVCKKQEWNRQRKLSHAWSGVENSRLIAAVRKRHALWDSDCLEYKISKLKSESWKAVAEELATQGIDANEAKLKWNSMRSNFKSYLAKHRAMKSRQDAEESFTVIWPHFKELMFIENAEIKQAGHAASDISMINAVAPRVSQRRKRPFERIAASSPVAPSQSGSMEPHERYSEFGNLIAAHLRKLQPDVSMEVEIVEKLNDFLSQIVHPTSSKITKAPRLQLEDSESLVAEANDMVDDDIKEEPDEDVTDVIQNRSQEIDTIEQPPNQQPLVDHHNERSHVKEDACIWDGNHSRTLQDDELNLYGALLVKKLRKFDELDRGDVMLAIDTVLNERTKSLILRQKNGDAPK